jgi:hypothetical protein
MKKSNLKILSLLMLVAIVVATVFSCKKTSFPPDPNDNIVVKRQLEVSALNAFTGDSIGQFSVTITTPSATVTQTATGNKYVLTNLVSGNYTVVVSKTGYNTSTAKTVSVSLPTDAKSSMIVNASVTLAKVAAAVAVTGTTGGVVTVKANSEVAASATVASVAVAPATVFTLADGTKPATVSISVTNVPVNTQLAPVVNVGGSNQVVVASIDVIKDQIPVKTLDLQPEGLTFSQPMVIDMYIGDMYPPQMSIADKTSKQAGLTLNYVRKDGTVEVLTPDHFSTDRNTVYYKITHFSQWHLLDNFLKIVKGANTKSAIQTKTSACGLGLNATFEYTTLYKMMDPADPYRPWLLTSQWADARYTVQESVNAPAQAGWTCVATWQCTLENWVLTDSCPGFWQQWKTRNIVIPVKGEKPTVSYVACHN